MNGTPIPPALLELTLSDLVPWVVLFGFILTLIQAFRKHVGPLLKKGNNFFDDWFGEEARPGVARRKGVIERLTIVEGQLFNNGGSSLRDAVDSTNESLKQVQSRLSVLEDKPCGICPNKE